MESLIYVGMDVHKDTYSLCCYTPGDGNFFAETTVDADARLVKKYLEEVGKGRPGSSFRTCYEAGCLGFSLYKELAKLGIDCRIVAPTTLAKEPGSSVKKTDRKDARMLARNLAFGLCRFVHIPDEIDLETKEFVRMRMAHKKAMKTKCLCSLHIFSAVVEKQALIGLHMTVFEDILKEIAAWLTVFHLVAAIQCVEIV